MRSSDLTPDQRERFARSVARAAIFLNRICRRMEARQFPIADPMYQRALHARNAIEQLHAGIRHDCTTTYPPPITQEPKGRENGTR